jgi:hypothetical protein
MPEDEGGHQEQWGNSDDPTRLSGVRPGEIIEQRDSSTAEIVIRPDSHALPGDDSYPVGVPLPRHGVSASGNGGHGNTRPKASRAMLVLVAMLICVVLILVFVLVVLERRSPQAAISSLSSSPTESATTPAALRPSPTRTSTLSPTPSSSPQESSTGGSSTATPVNTTPSPGSSQLPPGANFLGDPVDTDGDTGTGQDEEISGVDYADSTDQICPTEGTIDWDAVGFKVFTAMVGIADSEPHATGESATVTFFDEARRQLGAAKVSLGNPMPIRFSLNGATRLQITCTVSPQNGGFDVALGNAALVP